MYTITKEEYNKTHNDYKGTWSSDHIHNTNYNGKKTIMTCLDGCTTLLVQDVSFKIVDTEKENINPLK